MVDEKHVEKQWSSCDHRGGRSSLLSVDPLLPALPPEQDTEPFPGLPDLLQQHLNIQIRPINVSVKIRLNDHTRVLTGDLSSTEPWRPLQKVFLETVLTPAFEENLIYTSKGF